MNLKYDLYPILQDVSNVRLGESFEPHADRIVALFREALTSEEVVRGVDKAFGYQPLPIYAILAEALHIATGGQ